MIARFPPGIAKHLPLPKSSKAFHVEKFIPQPTVRALTISVLPWTAWFDVKSFNTLRHSPLLHRFGDELQAIVTEDIAGSASALGYGCFRNEGICFECRSQPSLAASEAMFNEIQPLESIDQQPKTVLK
jgi:hypothetical protein